MITINKTQTTPLYIQVYEAIKNDIFAGTLKSGELLPSTRNLAEELSISRNTVNTAYAQLLAEGFITAHKGSGFTVNAIMPDIPTLPELFPVHKKTEVCSDPALKNISCQVDEPVSCQNVFDYGSIDSCIYPHRAWRRSISHALDILEIKNGHFYPPRTGIHELKEAIISYLTKSRGVHCLPEQIVITGGHQYSMEIIANIFENSSKRFLMEEPGYDGIRQVFANHHYDITGIPVEKDGIATKDLLNYQGDLLYVTPSHQFPLGVVLPVKKRLELIHWAAQNNCYLIEDDYVNEIRYRSNPLPSLQSLDTKNVVIYTGTFSKSLSPDLRISYIIFPQKLLPVYTQYYFRYHGQTSALIQYALADFIRSGEYARQISRLRIYYKKKQAALCNCITEIFKEKAVIYGQGAGLHLLLSVDTPLSTSEMIQSAQKQNIVVYPISQHYLIPENCLKSTVLLGLSCIPTEKYPAVIQKLYDCWIKSNTPQE